MDAPWVDGPPEEPREPPPAEAMIEELRQAIRTARNDDTSEPLSEKRKRHVDRVEAMHNAIEFIAVIDSGLERALGDVDRLRAEPKLSDFLDWLRERYGEHPALQAAEHYYDHLAMVKDGQSAPEAKP